MLLSYLLPFLPLVAALPTEKRNSPAPVLLPRNNMTVIPGKYIVKMKDNSDAAALDGAMGLFAGDAHHTYSNVFKGFATELDESSLKALRDHPHVDYIEPDHVVTGFEMTQQHRAPWGLSRISHRQPGSPNYVFDDVGGEGVCAYIIDTGIDVDHPEFEGRATMATSFVPGSATDDNGHGTHVAGTLGSKTFGVAKKVALIGVKVLDRSSRGTSSAIVAGMDFVHEDARSRDCPLGVVINMSLGGSYLESQNAAAAKLSEDGFFVSVAAGNDDQDASSISPASEPSVCTVGATAKFDNRFDMSNWGPVVDIFAPGQEILSTLPDGRSGLLTGTSMASPHVAGLAAYLASLHRQRAGPELCEVMKQMALSGVIKDLPPDTVNLLAFNGASQEENPSGPDRDDHGPDNGTPGPDFGAPGPNFGVPGPDNGAPGPGFGPGSGPGPDFGTPGPDFGSPGPDFGAPGPDFGTPGPDFGTPGPEFGTPGPDFGPRPDDGEPSPNFGAPGPDFGPGSGPGPEFGNPGPDNGTPGPDFGTPGPESDILWPDIEASEPDGDFLDATDGSSFDSPGLNRYPYHAKYPANEGQFPSYPPEKGDLPTDEDSPGNGGSTDEPGDRTENDSNPKNSSPDSDNNVEFESDSNLEKFFKGEQEN